MEDVFRFMVIRPPESNKSSLPVSIDIGSSYQKDLKGSRQSEDPWSSMVNCSRGFISSESFLDDVARLKFHDKLKELKKRLATPQQFNLALLEKLIKEIFALSSLDLIKNNDFQTDRKRANQCV